MRIGCSKIVAPATGLPPSRNWPRTDAHGRSRSVPASCWSAGNSASANPASARTTTANGSPGSGNAKRPAASVVVLWLSQSDRKSACSVGVASSTSAFAAGWPAASRTTPATGWTRLEAEILRAGGVVADAELRPVLRAVARRLDPQPQRDVGARRQKIQPAVLAGHGVAAFRAQQVLAEHVDGNHGEGRDRLARHRIGHAAGDAVLGLQHRPCALGRRRRSPVRETAKPFDQTCSFTGSSGAQVHSHTPSASAWRGILVSGTLGWLGLWSDRSDLLPFHPLRLTSALGDRLAGGIDDPQPDRLARLHAEVLRRQPGLEVDLAELRRPAGGDDRQRRLARRQRRQPEPAVGVGRELARRAGVSRGRRPCTTSASLIGLPAGSVTRPRTMTPRFSVSVAVPLPQHRGRDAGGFLSVPPIFVGHVVRVGNQQAQFRLRMVRDVVDAPAALGIRRRRVASARQPSVVARAAVAVGGLRIVRQADLHLGAGDRLALLVHDSAAGGDAGFQPDRVLGRDSVAARQLVLLPVRRTS